MAELRAQLPLVLCLCFRFHPPTLAHTFAWAFPTRAVRPPRGS
jgi:hypothetical protein